MGTWEWMALDEGFRDVEGREPPQSTHFILRPRLHQQGMHSMLCTLQKASFKCFLYSAHLRLADRGSYLGLPSQPAVSGLQGLGELAQG